MPSKSDIIKKDLDDLTAGFAKLYLYVLDQDQSLQEHPDHPLAREAGREQMDIIMKGLAQKMDKIRRELYGQ